MYRRTPSFQMKLCSSNTTIMRRRRSRWRNAPLKSRGSSRKRRKMGAYRLAASCGARSCHSPQCSALDADQLFGAALLVLEPADREVPAPHAELLADALQRGERRDLLLVHPVDPDVALRILVEAESLAHDEVLWPLLDLHRLRRTASARRR